MKNHDKIIRDVQKEVDLQDLLGGGLSLVQVKARMFQDLEGYFTDKESLTLAIETGVFNYEYGFLLKLSSEQWFQENLDLMIKLFSEARVKNKIDCYEFLVSWDKKTDRAITNTMQMYHLETSKSGEHLDLVTKVIFRELGDLLEGSLQPFMKLVLAMNCIRQGKSVSTGHFDSLSFGSAADELISSQLFEPLYKPKPWEIKINQWRNIANHNDYKVSIEDQHVVCEYGNAKSKRTIILLLNDMYTLIKRCYDIYYLHKIAHAFFFADHAKEIISMFPSIIATQKLTDDSIQAQMIAFIYSRGFNLKGFKKSNNLWEYDLEDKLQRNRNDTIASLQEIGGMLTVLKVRDQLLIRVMRKGKIQLQVSLLEP